MSVRNLKKKSETDWDRIDRMTDDEIDTSDIPPLDDAFFERARTIWPRIYIDRLDLIEARRFAAHILDKRWPNKKGEITHKAFNISLIISYGRPFSRRYDLDGHPEPLLDEQISKVLNENEAKLHKRVKKLRHRSYAHSDAGSHLFEELDYTKYSFPLKEHLPLDRADVELLLGMIEKWIDYLEAREPRLKRQRR